MRVHPPIVPTATRRTVTAWHGSSVPVRRFSPRHGAQGVMWFSTDRDAILAGTSGAALRAWLMTVELTVDRTAGWDLYERLTLGEVERLGYDSIQLDDDWIIFDPRRVRVTARVRNPAGVDALAARVLRETR